MSTGVPIQITLCEILKSKYISSEWQTGTVKGRTFTCQKGETIGSVFQAKIETDLSMVKFYKKDLSVTSEVDPSVQITDNMTIGYWVSKPLKKGAENPATPAQKAASSADTTPATPSTVVKTEVSGEKGLPKVFNFEEDHLAAQKGFQTTPIQNNSIFLAGSTCCPEMQEFLADWLGLGEKEGLVGANFTPGHVNHQFMENALSRAKCVVLVNTVSGGTTGKGGKGTGTIFKSTSGSLYLLTNEHVIQSAAVASLAWFMVDFVHDSNFNPKKFCLDSNTFFCDKTLDYALVRVEPDADLMNREWLAFGDVRSELPVKFESVNIISHPRGKPVEYSIRGMNYLREDAANVQTSNMNALVKHGAYTLPGSSGALLFGDDWKPFALHRQRGAKQEINGKVQKFDPQSPNGRSDYNPNVDSEYDILYEYNIAVRLTAVFNDAKSKGFKDLN